MAGLEGVGARKESEDEPDTARAPGLPWMRVTRFVARMSMRHPFLLLAVVLASFGVAASEVISIGLIFPFLESLGGGALRMPEGFALGFLVPYFEEMSAEQTVRAIAVLLVAVQVFRGVLTYVEQRVAAYLGIILERDMRQLVFDELLRVELRYIHKERVANLFTILHTYPRQSAGIVKDYLASFSKIVIFLTYVGMMVLVSWQLTLIAMALGITSTLIVDRLRRTLKSIARRINESRVRLHQVSLESLTAMKVIRLFAREEHARRKFLDEVKALQRDSYRKASISSAAAPLQRTLNMALFASLLILATLVLDQSSGGWLVLLTAFILIISRLMGPLSQFSSKRASIAGDIPALEELITFVEGDKPVMREGERRFDRLREGVRFEGVTFSYDAQSPPVVGPVTFEVPRGKLVALVGESGSGKSTLINLLARLSDPTSGRILVDGEDLRSFQSATWRRRVAVVSQDTFLFNDTVRENIRYGRLEATDAEVEEAARKANAHEFILQMEQGYDTPVGDRGVRLSGGQAQRLAIARAILADPDVLVLDEATSALDTATERLVQEAIEVVSRERTVISVAHRLSTVRHADQILVLDKGLVVERGTHDELMAMRGRYWSFVQLQDLSESGEPRAPSTPAAPVADAPARRVPVAAAPEPMRVLLTEGKGTARVVNGSLVAEGVPLVVLREGDRPHEKLRASRGDVALVQAGATHATVRVDGRVHDGVPLFMERAEGAPRPVRVRAVNVPDEGRVGKLLKRISG